MLVLSRKLGETIVIDGNIRVTVVAIRGNQIRLGIEAPKNRAIMREELCSRGELVPRETNAQSEVRAGGASPVAAGVSTRADW